MEEFVAIVKNALGQNAERFLELCGGDFDAAIKTSSVCSVELAIRALKRREEALGMDIPYYYYIANHEMPGWDNPGAFHSSDLWFWFETLAKCWRPFKGKHYDLGRQMCNYLANFVKTGNPNGSDSDETPMPEWRPYSDRTPNAMLFSDTPTPIISEPDERMSLLVESYLANKKNTFR
jgi:para-nitrobenzyl esterase